MSEGRRRQHPTESLDDLVHQRARLGILAVVNEAHRVDFNYLLETLALTGGNLSQHLRVLEEGGLVSIEKAIDGRRTRTWVSITRSGRRSFLREVEALEDLVASVKRRGTQRAQGKAAGSIHPDVALPVRR